jgi:hypothetical protein
VSRAPRVRAFAAPRRLACGHTGDRGAAKGRAWHCLTCAIARGWALPPLETTRRRAREAERLAG